VLANLKAMLNKVSLFMAILYDATRYDSHRAKKNDEWLNKYEGCVQFHFTPTSASWLNQIEIWFGILCKTACKNFQGPGEKSVEKFPPQVV
jgi:hypothetical protein